MDEYASELRMESTVKTISSIMFPADLSGNEFQRVGAATEKALVPMVFTEKLFSLFGKI